MIYGPQQLANQLKLFRTINNLTQAQVAKRVGIKQATISNFENDPDHCQLQTLFKIMQALQVGMLIETNNTESLINSSNPKNTDEDW